MVNTDPLKANDLPQWLDELYLIEPIVDCSGNLVPVHGQFAKIQRDLSWFT